MAEVLLFHHAQGLTPGVSHPLRVESDRRRDDEHREDQQHGGLRESEGRLGLRRRQCFEGRHLLEELYDQHENIEIEGGAGADHIDITPGAGEALSEAGPSSAFPSA